MSLFHSLGSSYTNSMVWKAARSIIQPWSNQVQREEQVLASLQPKSERSERTVFTYKGRDAIELACRSIMQAVKVAATSKTGQRYGVLTQGLACHAIEEGVVRAGLVPVYVDLEPGTLGPSVATVRAAMRRAATQQIQPIALFLQHTLGYGNPVKELSALARSEGLFLIEDLAQSYGATDLDGHLLGSNADVIIYSFGRDKILDGVSGGAVSVRHPAVLPHLIKKISDVPPRQVITKELLYPLLTQVIRKTHRWGVGKGVFRIAKLLRLFTSPIATSRTYPTRLPAAYLELVIAQLVGLDEQLTHRRLCARQYIQELSGITGARLLLQEDIIMHDAHLRVPVLVDNPEVLRLFFKKAQRAQIFLTDRWYRSVVDSGSLALASVYKPGDCPEAERVSQHLLNLPTHRHVTPAHIRTMCQLLRESLEEKGTHAL